MKKTALALATLLALTACGGDNATGSSSSGDTASTPTTQTQAAAPSQEKKAEHYAVGVDTASPPFSFNNEQGLITGFDIEVLQAIADDQNFSFDKFPAPFEGVFGDLEKGKYQIISANLAITPERQEKYIMAKSHIYTPNVIMGKEGSTVKTLADIGEQSAAVVANSISHDALTKAGVKNIVGTDSMYNAYAAFIRGGADYVVGDAGVLNYHHINSGVADKIKVHTVPYGDDDFAYVGFLMPKDQASLAEKINTGLANIRANGKYDEIYKKWFGDDQSLKVPADKQ